MAKQDQIGVLFVRSGSTEWDDAGRLQGETDLPLSESGRGVFAAGLDAVLEQSEPFPIGVALHAPDEASAESAAMLAMRAGVRAKRIDGLAEIDLGLWEGLRCEELEERYPTAYGQWVEDPTSVTPPDGPTLVEVEARLLATLIKALDRPGRQGVAVVLRPLSYALMLCWLDGEAPRHLAQMSEESPACVWATVSRERLRAALEALRANA